jgi:Ca2+-binding RTX toxin-like protein
MGAALLLASRIALSEALTGTNGDDILHGSRERDTIADGNGDDELYGHKEKDRLYGDSGADYLDGGNGNDKLFGGLGERVNPETPSP